MILCIEQLAALEYSLINYKESGYGNQYEKEL